MGYDKECVCRCFVFVCCIRVYLHFRPRSKWQPNYCGGNTPHSIAALQFMCATFLCAIEWLEWLKWLMIYEAGRNRVTNEIETKMATNGRISFPIYYFRRFSYKHNPFHVCIFPLLLTLLFPRPLLSIRREGDEAFSTLTSTSTSLPPSLSLFRISFHLKKWFMVERCGQSSLVLLCMKCFCH